ncbi:MAG: MGMT family protein [Candidatus Aenigmarchaeota archaeon]|nr:MGMT family protein [Candidatus Aenigmarchaeota archaeon]MDI6722276.1 MGMT family protein [Candidatus Aenigmarchaeota archaeon]
MSKSIEVYSLLQKIPKGKVVTYNTLAKACNTSPRAIGALMRCNKYPDLYPCYKVVKSSGEIGGYSAGGKKMKIKLLKKAGIKVSDGKVDLKKFVYDVISLTE